MTSIGSIRITVGKKAADGIVEVKIAAIGIQLKFMQITCLSGNSNK